MTATKLPVAEALWLGPIRDILRLPGPSITILLPPYRPGQAVGSPRDLLKAYIREAALQLAQRAYPKPAIVDLLKPLEALAADPRTSAPVRNGVTHFCARRMRLSSSN